MSGKLGRGRGTGEGKGGMGREGEKGGGSKWDGDKLQKKKYNL